MRNSTDVSIHLGMAGMLHDCSLARHLPWLARTMDVAEFGAKYRSHSFESADLLTGIDGLQSELIEVVSQVHEQNDGSGFPSGLTHSDICFEAKLLNFIDAFLELTDPMLCSRRYLEADALSYLCHHAIQGAFDRGVAMQLIESIGLYPIGTAIELDDRSMAVVVDSIPGAPSQPMIAPMERTGALLDLSKSQRYVVAPVPFADRADVQRISKTELNERRW